MSISSLIFILSCLGSYYLGNFNARNPGRSWELIQTSCVWVWRSLSK